MSNINKIENHLLSYWNGKEKLWKAFWLMGFAFQIFLLFFFIFIIYIGSLIGLSWSIQITIFLISIIYTIWIYVSIWNCAYNVKKKYWGHIARFYIILNIILFFLLYSGIIEIESYQNIIKQS